MSVSVTTTGLQNAANVASTLAASQWAIATGTSDAITAAYPVPNTALSDGMVLAFRALAANLTNNPTFAPDGLPAHVITKGGGIVLSVSDIANPGFEALLRYNATLGHWELLNPEPANLTNSQVVVTGTHTLNSATENGKTLNLGGNAYYTLNCGDPATFVAQFSATLINTDRFVSSGDGTQGRAKLITIGGTLTFSFKLWPGQALTVMNISNVWYFLPGGQGGQNSGARWKIPSIITLYVDGILGSTNADGLGSGVSAYSTITLACLSLYQDLDLNNFQCRVKIADGTYTESVTIANIPVGSNFWYLEGNLSSPNVIIQAPGNNTVCVFAQDNAEIGASGITYSSNGHSGCTATAFHQYSIGDFGLSSIGTFPKSSYGGFGTGTHILGDTNAKINMYDYDVTGGGNAHVSVGAGCIFSQAAGFTHSFTAAGFAVAVFVGSSPGCFIALAGVYSGSVTGQKYAINGLCGLTAPGVTIPGSTAGGATNGALSF